MKQGKIAIVFIVMAAMVIVCNLFCLASSNIITKESPTVQFKSTLNFNVAKSSHENSKKSDTSNSESSNSLKEDLRLSDSNLNLAELLVAPWNLIILFLSDENRKNKMARNKGNRYKSKKGKRYLKHRYYCKKENYENKIE